jgi:NADH:ubiquinone reductase (H+-translocating)
MDTTPGRPRVVIVGSGFGGLFAAQALERAEVDVTMLARTTHHLFQPLLYQVATGILSPGAIAPATREVLAKQDNVEVVLGDVTAIDVESRRITATTLGIELDYDYDYLVLAAGAEQSYFGNDDFARNAPGMKSIDDALELRGRIYGAFELAEVAAARGNQEALDRLMTFVVVGAGPTGVEMVGQLVELAHRTLRRDFRHIDPRDARIVLLDAADAVLGTFHPELQASTQAELGELGVDVRLGAKVVDLDSSGLDYVDAAGAEHRIEAATKVWAAGVSASPLGRMVAEQCGVEVDRAGRVPVQSDLSLPGHPEIFVVGDMMALDDLPGVAQVAIQGARHAADHIRRALRGDHERRDFAYNDKGNMATISRFRAVAEVGALRVTGFTAWVMWLVVHLFYIIGFKSQVTTLIHWAVTWLGSERGERTITEQQVFGRLAMLASGREIRDKAARTIGPVVPDGDIPDAAKEQPGHQED